jgi:hypothetical protein
MQQVVQTQTTTTNTNNNQANSFACVKCGEMQTEESGAYDGFICEECNQATEYDRVEELQQQQQQVITKRVVVVESKTPEGAIKRSSITDLSIYKFYKNIMMSVKNEKEKLVSD